MLQTRMYDDRMAGETDRATVGAPPRMDGVQLPRRVTKADVPRLPDRIGEVWNTNGRYRSVGEWVVHLAALVAVIIAVAFIWASSASAVQKVTESLGVMVMAVLIATPVLLKLRFHP